MTVEGSGITFRFLIGCDVSKGAEDGPAVGPLTTFVGGSLRLVPRRILVMES